MKHALSVTAVVSASALLAAAGLQRLGAFDKVQWVESEFAGCTVIYIEHVGPYKGIGMVFDELISLLKTKAGLDVSFRSNRFLGAQAPCMCGTPQLRSILAANGGVQST